MARRIRFSCFPCPSFAITVHLDRCTCFAIIFVVPISVYHIPITMAPRSATELGCSLYTWTSCTTPVSFETEISITRMTAFFLLAQTTRSFHLPRHPSVSFRPHLNHYNHRQSIILQALEIYCEVLSLSKDKYK